MVSIASHVGVPGYNEEQELSPVRDSRHGEAEVVKGGDKAGHRSSNSLLVSHTTPINVAEDVNTRRDNYTACPSFC